MNNEQRPAGPPAGAERHGVMRTLAEIEEARAILEAIVERRPSVILDPIVERMAQQPEPPAESVLAAECAHQVLTWVLGLEGGGSFARALRAWRERRGADVH